MEKTYSLQEIKRARRAHLGANCLSLARPLLASVCAVMTLRDAHPVAKVAANTITEASDAEGQIVRKWSNGSFKRGEVKTSRDALAGLRDVVKRDTPLSEWILSLDGRWLDERLDKVAQNIRRGALLLKGEIGLLNASLPLLRDELVSNAREHYAELGVTDVESAGKLGKAKTLVMGAGFIAKAASNKGTSDGMISAGTALSVISAVDYFAQYEKAYQENVWEDEPLSYGQYAVSGLSRVIEYTYNKRLDQASKALSFSTMTGPELSSRAA